jgi:predicted DNA-binding protein
MLGSGGTMNTTRPKSRKKGKMPRSSVSFSPEVQEELNRLAVKRKVSVAWIVREAVDRYLANENPLFHQVQ